MGWQRTEGRCEGEPRQAGLAWAVLSTGGWRWLLGLSSLPLLVLLLLYPIIPESPYYLAVSGQQDQALAVLQQIAAVNHASLPPGVLSQPVAARGRLGARMTCEVCAHAWCP